MRNYVKLILMIVVSIILTTITACSSRKMNKSKIETSSAAKKSVEVDSLKSVKSKSEITETSSVKSDYKIGNENLSIVYEATFDMDGKLIPFSYSKNDNGKTTKVDIVGPGKVINTTIIKREEVDQQVYKSIKKEIDSLVNVQVNYKLDSIATSTVSTKDVKVAPDYIKYIIWLGIGMLILAGILVAGFIYFKATIGKYKKIIDKIV